MQGDVNMTIFYFTATGNSLYVAKRIGGELYSMPQLLKAGRREFADEAIGFVFPCYGFGIPRLVQEFILGSKFTAKYFFAVMTYGNVAASGLRHLEQVGKQAGIAFSYTNEILMIDNYLPVFMVEDQLKKENAKNIEENLDQIVSDIHGRRRRTTRKGLATAAISKIIYCYISSKFDGGDKTFSVGDNCNGCKVCEKVCPKNNIKVAAKPEFAHNCDRCLACIHHCPQTAIHMKSERSNARFRNRNVELQEIIAANNQGGSH
jgi:ferredoxin